MCTVLANAFGLILTIASTAPWMGLRLYINKNGTYEIQDNETQSVNEMQISTLELTSYILSVVGPVIGCLSLLLSYNIVVSKSKKVGKVVLATILMIISFACSLIYAFVYQFKNEHRRNDLTMVSIHCTIVSTVGAFLGSAIYFIAIIDCILLWRKINQTYENSGVLRY